MGYSQSKKLSLSEKKLAQLKMQLYGKEQTISQPQHSYRADDNTKFKASDFQFTPSHSTTSVSVEGSIKADLVKTVLLAALAVGAQLAIYFSLNRGLIRF
ncbi:hypothetical protein HY389_00885 [Candidatus Daviesbacteria bacterium]|nr:hypothetical protein [Candidatus Daviesbacteria bacterium]